MKKILSILLVVIMLFAFTACGLNEEEILDIVGDVATDIIEDAFTESTEYPTEDVPSDIPFEENDFDYENPVKEDEYYYDVENVVLYIHLYGRLPDNYITKEEARSLGWDGGSVEPYFEGGAIGGDYFGNREGLLPEGEYTECDIDTLGKDSRGAKRLVFSDDGLYFYTEDHYESFTEIIIENNEVIFK